MGSEYAVEMKNITKRFGGLIAVDNVSLQIKSGEIHALCGENGAGKSTLMNVLTGKFPPNEGEIYLKGEKKKIHNPKDARNEKITIVHQELELIPDLSIAENIFLGNQPKTPSGVDWKKMYSEAEEILKKFSLNLNVKTKIKYLTVGQQQLVEIAKAIYLGGNVLILDEPTAVLTNIEAQNLFNSMHRLKEQGTAMVFITHHLDEVMEETDRITIMKDGQLVEEVPTSEITKEEMITKMAGKKVNVAKHIKRTYSKEKFFEAKNLTRTGEFENVSFDVKKGEILCVAGLVGAGRTGIFKCVFGITEKEPGGHTFIEGKEVNIKSPIEAIKYGMGYVSEERRHDGITPGMSVKENMILPSYGQMTKNGLIDYKKITEIVDQYIDSMSIKTASRETLIKNLSGGNQQKVIVARWMAKNVKMLILDEPTRGIDVNAKGEIYDLIRTLADNGVAVVVISSEMEEVLALADRIMVIHAGKVSGFIDQVETTSQEDVLKVAFQ